MIRVQSTRKRIERLIELHHKMKWSYFRKPPTTAKERRAMERLRSDYFKFRHKGVKYIVDQNTRCTCNNVYYRLHITVDGKKKDYRVLKRLVDWDNQRDLERIQAKLLASVNKNYDKKRGPKRKWQPNRFNPYV